MGETDGSAGSHATSIAISGDHPYSLPFPATLVEAKRGYASSVAAAYDIFSLEIGHGLKDVVEKPGLDSTRSAGLQCTLA